MKKILAILLAAMMLLSMVACDLGGNPSGNEDNPGTSQSDNQGDGEEVSGQDYDNVGFTKAQRQVIAEQVGVTVEGERIVFMCALEEDDEVIYFEVYDEFDGTSSQYSDWRFCISKEAFDGEHSDAADTYDDLTADEKNLYLCGSEENLYGWKTWQEAMDYYNEHLKSYNEYILVE